MAGKAAVILVADDQPGVRWLVQELFADGRYQVLLAAHGQEAVAAARRQPPDVALIDLRMPVMDGVETLRALREMYPDLPVVVMTAVDDSDRVDECLRLGARCAVIKPFDVFELRSLVEATLAGPS